MKEQSLSILVVDDDPDFTDGLERQQRRLKNPQIDISSSNSIEEAIDQYEDLEQFDLVVVDFNLNNSFSAFDLLREYRRVARDTGGADLTHTLPFVISSNEDFESLAKRPDFYKNYSEFSIASYIHKGDLGGFRGIEKEVLSIYEAYCTHLRALNRKLNDDLKRAAQSALLSSIELEHFVVLIDKRARHRRDESVSRLCSETQKRNRKLLGAVTHLGDPSLARSLATKPSYFSNFKDEDLYYIDLLPPGAYGKRLAMKISSFFLEFDTNKHSELEASKRFDDCFDYAEKHRCKEELMAAISWKAGGSEDKSDLSGVRALATIFGVLRSRGEIALAGAIATVCETVLRRLGRPADANQFLRYVSQHSTKPNRKVR